MLAVESKTCTECGIEKRLDEFHRHAQGKLGRHSKCKACKSLYAKSWAASSSDRRAQYRVANAERRAAWDKAWRERTRGDRAAYREANRERRAAQRREWRRANPDRVADHNARRRAREVGTVDTDALWQHYGGNCALCYTKIDRSLRHPDPMSASLDHAVPLSKGGTHTQDNLQWTHLTCNVRKGNRD